MSEIFVINDNVIEKKQDVEIKNLVIPDGIIAIGPRAFQGDTNIETVVFPDSLKTISYSAFQDCSNLKRIELPDTLELIDSRGFSCCTSLREVIVRRSDLPIDAVGSIGGPAFAKCPEITVLQIPKGIKEIKFYAFMNSHLIEELDVPETVTIISSNAFSSKLHLGESEYCTVNSLLIGWNRYNESIKKVEIPEGITTIGTHAFMDYDWIEEVVFPEGLEEIGGGAFYELKKLKNVEFSDTVKIIGGQAFKNCARIEKLNLPNGIVSIEGQAFCGCNRISKVEIPDNTKRIEREAFGQCKKLESIKLPLKKIRIDDDAFKGSKLLKIDLPEGFMALQDKLPDALCGFIGNASEADIDIMAKNKSKKWKTQVAMLKEKTE